MKLYFDAIIYTVVIFCLSAAPGPIWAANDNPVNNAVMLTATTAAVPKPEIVVRWQDNDPKTSSYVLLKKSLDDVSWKMLASLDSTKRSYRDTNVLVGRGYEYSIVKSAPDYKGYGFIYSGIEIGAVHDRGKVMLIVDKTMSQPLFYELRRFERDLAGDGWKVVRLDVPRMEYFNPAAVQTLKRLIRQEYQSSPDRLKSVILFGRVAVPYSGTEAYDGHSDHDGNHTGAWPADVYYSDMTGIWTDTVAFATSGYRLENHNVPLDGKFDQTTVPGSSDLQVGRIDMFNLPAYTETETALLRNYLDKDHRYRHGLVDIRPKGLIDDKFRMYGNESFASDAWMNFPPLLGTDNIDSGLTIQSEMEKNSYLWAYGCNPGGFNSVQNVIYTDYIAFHPLNGVFMMLLGSYLPDWDEKDNIMRATIASSPSMLTCCFAGFPFWHLHHMALGRTIGYSTMVTQNNIYAYQTAQKNGTRGIHISLMGDPTLRMQIVKPPADLFQDLYNRLDDTTAIVKISWKKPVDDIIGYYIYKARDYSGTFERLNGEPVTETSFTDLTARPGRNIYMVRALKLETTPSGTFYNLSQGSYFESDSVLSVDETPAGDVIEINISPNPASQMAEFRFDGGMSVIRSIQVIDLNGRVVKSISPFGAPGEINTYQWDLKDNKGLTAPPGTYLLKISTRSKTQVAKFLINP